MADEGKEVKLLKCGMCQDMKPSADFSSKQKKAKGKRKCASCIDIVSGNALNGGDASNIDKDGMVIDVKAEFQRRFYGKDTAVVKDVLADDVNSLQTSYVKGQSDVSGKLDDKYDVLIKWLIDGGATFPHLQLKYYTVDYRGVHTNRRLDADQEILAVPLDLIMTSEVAKESKIGRRIAESGCQLRSSHSWLACFLLQEKYNTKSKFKPYIDTVPQHYRNMPIFFDNTELKELEGSFTLKMISDRKLALKSEYDNICKFVPEFARYHHLDFFWARLAVITRIFGFEVGNLKTDGLVAMADMLNHKRPNETSWTYDNAKGAFTITTTKKLLKGAQVFDSYGRKCNSRYFVNYGFSLDFNEDNQCAYFVRVPPPTVEEVKESPDAEVLYGLKCKIVGGYERRFQIPFEHKEKVTKKMMSFLRVAHATADELKTIISTKQAQQEIFWPLSIETELKVMKHTHDAAVKCLAGFNTTVEEDNKLLEAGNLTMNVRNCVIMRRGEKEVCEAYIDLWKTLDVVKDMDGRNLRKYLANNVNNRGPQPTFAWRKEKYFQELWLPLLEGRGNKPVPGAEDQTPYWESLEKMNNSLGE